ncbi:MAG: 6-carboxytetrahydropterin synthase [Bacteroidales bacterium]|jgi:6-pyruvoyltetrahydropterin/6-carboxytetrahydropterin synthase
MNPQIRVTREFGFEMAHVLFNYDGPCRNVHGHSYRLFVTVAGVPVNDPADPKNGMVIDFTDLKNIVLGEIVNIFDHSVVISSDFDKQKTEMMSKTFGNTVIVAYQPTCENLVADFASRIRSRLPASTTLHSLKLYETAKSYAEWFAEDNMEST